MSATRSCSVRQITSCGRSPLCPVSPLSSTPCNVRELANTLKQVWCPKEAWLIYFPWDSFKAKRDVCYQVTVLQKCLRELSVRVSVYHREKISIHLQNHLSGILKVPYCNRSICQDENAVELQAAEFWGKVPAGSHAGGLTGLKIQEGYGWPGCCTVCIQRDQRVLNG